MSSEYFSACCFVCLMLQNVQEGFINSVEDVS